MTQSIFESIKHINEHEQEYWSARELYKILEYTEYRKLIPTIEKAKIACENSGQDSQDHFADVSDMVSIGSDAKREVSDYHLSRYACYLIIQNADPSKKRVADGQTYFAIQTHRQETADTLIEDKKRVYLREELTEHNKSLASTAKSA
jgi:DNA-damage-inducible protein D